MSSTIPSREEIYNGFEFTQKDITIEPIRPSGVKIQKLIKGFRRNVWNQYSSRPGCRGAEMGHKWMCMQQQDWDDEQSIILCPTFTALHTRWKT